MELNNYELEIILQALRVERHKAEKNHIQALRTELNKNDCDNEEYALYGISDTMLTLQRFNNLIIKVEDELRNRNKSLI